MYAFANAFWTTMGITLGAGLALILLAVVVIVIAAISEVRKRRQGPIPGVKRWDNVRPLTPPPPPDMSA